MGCEKNFSWVTHECACNLLRPPENNTGTLPVKQYGVMNAPVKLVLGLGRSRASRLCCVQGGIVLEGLQQWSGKRTR